MGHGRANNNYQVVVAVRELIQNSADAGAKSIKVGLMKIQKSWIVAVLDDVPPAYRLSRKVFEEVFLVMDTSSKPGVSAGGKGQAKAMLSSCSGLFMAGLDGFKATVGQKYAASVDSSSSVSTYRTATAEDREALANGFAKINNLPDGGLVAVVVRGADDFVPDCVDAYLALCDVPGVTVEYHASCIPPKSVVPIPVVDSKTIVVKDLKLKLTIIDEFSTKPAGLVFAALTTEVVVHVKCRGVLMFSAVMSLHDMCNSSKLEVIVEIEAIPGRGIQNSDIFTIQRGGLRSERIGTTCVDIARLAMQEFENQLHKPTKKLRSGRVVGRAILSGVPAKIMDRLKLKASNGVAACYRKGDVTKEIRMETSRDRLDAATLHETMEQEVKAAFSVPIMVSDNGTGKLNDHTFVPTKHELALIQYVTLLVTVGAAKYDRPPPSVGILYTDDEAVVGLATQNGIFLNLAHYMDIFKDADPYGCYEAFLVMLNGIHGTAMHELAHELVDIGQSHSRAFWDVCVDLLNDMFIKSCALFLNKELCPATLACGTTSHEVLLDSFAERLDPGDCIIVDADCDSEPDDLCDASYMPPKYPRRKRAKVHRLAF